MPTKLYKLTNSNGNTRNNFHWEIGITHTIPENGVPKLCTNKVLHAYETPLLAAFMNPTHVNYPNPRCFEVEGDIIVSDGTKVGCKSLKVTGTFELPNPNRIQRIAFGILCTLEVYSETCFVNWANNWLNGTDRTYASAYAAAAAIDLYTVAYTPYATTYPYAIAYTYAAAYADISDADAISDAVTYVAYAASKKIDFIALSEKAMTYAY